VDEATVPDHEPLVRQLLAASGLTPSEEEVRQLVAMYPILRMKADRLYELDLADQP